MRRALLLAASAAGAAEAPLYVDCRGTPSTSPTVILEAGAFGTSADWDYVLDDLSAGGRVCAYDRAGIGRSPDRPGDRGGSRQGSQSCDDTDQQSQ